MARASAPDMTPVWLDPADVKKWLRVMDQDSSDDDLIAAACAMTEPYVQRCRPEWQVRVVPFGIVRLDIRSADGHANIRFEEWQAAHPSIALDIMDGNAHVFVMYVDPFDHWATLTPTLAGKFTADTGTGLEGNFVRNTDGDSVTSGQLAAWSQQRTQIGFTYVASGPHFTAETQLNTYLPDAETYQGGVMYAAREYRRRNSPAGIESFGDTTSFVSRFDPDIDRALHTGSYARPVIA